VSAPAAGRYRIEVEGVNVMTGVPELAPDLRQDFALVAAPVMQLGDESPASAYQIDRVFVRRNHRWPYIIIGATVLDAHGMAASPGDGVSVQMAVTQGVRTVESGDLPYYDRGQYHIWRLRLAQAGLASGPARVDVIAHAGDATVTSTSQTVTL
jgi:hypothetical protein